MPLLFDTDEDDVLTDDDVFENLGDDEDEDEDTDTEAIGGPAPDDDDDEDEDDGPPTTPLTPGIDDVPPDPIPYEPVCSLNPLNFLTAPLTTSEHHEFVNSTFFPPSLHRRLTLTR